MRFYGETSRIVPIEATSIMSNIEQQFRIAEIDVSNIAADERVAGLFRFEQPGATNRGPTLLLIADIHSSLYVYERLLDLLNATVEQARRLTVTVGQDPVGRFEKIVQRINETVADFAEKEASPLNWKRISIFLFELTDGHLCVTGTGRLMNAFFQKQPNETFRAFDLLGSLEQPVEVDPRKPFASIICGDMTVGDVLMVGTENLERLRGELQIKERLTTLPPVTAALDIRQDLERRAIPDHFVAAIIACQAIKMPTAPTLPITAETSSKDTSTASIEKLRSAEEETSQRLSPAIPPIKTFNPKEIWPLVYTSLRRVSTWCRCRLFRRDGKLFVDKVALASLRSMNAGYGSFFTKRRKAGVIAIAALVVAILMGILWWKHTKIVTAETAIWNTAYEKAADQKNRAESDLIYGNDTRARNEIAAAEQVLDSLPQKSAKRRQTVDKLMGDLRGLKERLKKIVKMDSVIELATSAGNAPDDLAAPILTTDAAYVVDHARSAILKVNLATKAVKAIRLPTPDIRLVAATKGKDTILFTTAHGSLIALKKSDDSIHALPWTHTRTSSTADIFLYTGKLYSLDPQKNQVWRSTNTGSGFGGESAYIKATNASLTNALSLAIDSNVYILQSDGTVLRYLLGGQEGFSLAAIDPPMKSASAIWTELDNDRIVIADPAEKRVVFFDKNGVLKAQVLSSQFKSPRDLDADEASKRILVVDGNRLLLVPMP